MSGKDDVKTGRKKTKPAAKKTPKDAKKLKSSAATTRVVRRRHPEREIPNELKPLRTLVTLFLQGLLSNVRADIPLRLLLRGAFYVNVTVLTVVLGLPWALWQYALPVVKAAYQDPYVAVLVESALPQILLTLAVLPFAFIWQDGLAALSLEVGSGLMGGGRQGVRAFFSSGRLGLVQTDCAMLAGAWVLYAVVAFWAAAGGLAEVAEGFHVMGCVAVLGYISHSPRLERVTVSATRGRKAEFVTTRLPYFIGFAGPSALLVRWVSLTHPSSTAAIFGAAIIHLTIASGAVGVEPLRSPLHRNTHLLTLPHFVVSNIFPTTSGCGVT